MAKRKQPQPWWQRIIPPAIRRIVPRLAPRVPVPLIERRDKRLSNEGFLRWERTWMVKFPLSAPWMRLARKDRRAITRFATKRDLSNATFYRLVASYYASHNWAGKGVPSSVLVQRMLGFYFDLAVKKGLIPKPMKPEDYPLSIIPKPKGWALRQPRYKGDVVSQKQRARERERETRQLELSGAERAREEQRWRSPARLDEVTRRFV